MSVIKTLVLVSISFSASAASWKPLYKTSPASPVATVINTCPAGYIGVPALVPYTTRFFCVAKYEMQIDAYGTAISSATASPSGDIKVDIKRIPARDACRALGTHYDLISNDQWQTIARNIASTPINWSSGVVGSGEINRGHTDGVPNIRINPVSNDNDPCAETGQTCTALTWNSQKRTHKLSNGNVIWDFSGNVTEWVSTNNTYNYTPDTFASQLTAGSARQIAFGADATTLCATPGATPWCGMGKSLTVGPYIGVTSRGGCFSMGTDAGIFTSDLRDDDNQQWPDTGFRCVYLP